MTSKHQFKLKTGREIQISIIYQWATYTGLLEGLPTQKMNQRIIKQSIAKSREWWSMKPYLVEPSEVLITTVNDYPFGKPERLPTITCLARFICREAVHKDMDYSELAILWFQSEFALPIDELVTTKICEIEWDVNAIDREH